LLGKLRLNNIRNLLEYIIYMGARWGMKPFLILMDK
jgi:hypothetical protein